jgi:hypothetical protein
MMKFGLSLPPIGPYSDPNDLAALADEAEQAGWDGFFIWDHVAYSDPVHPIVDPWIALAAVAMRTKRIRLGPMITSLARRRPWKVARETASLDLLSSGRLIFGVGLGEPADRDFGTFGEAEDPKIRARKLDEGLTILDGLWRGEPFSFQGDFYTVRSATFLPKPVQQPRPPVWVGGGWNKHAPQRRAARWDGFFPLKWREIISVSEWRVIIDYLGQHGVNHGAYDLVQAGLTPGHDTAHAAEIVDPFREIGLTWWIEQIDPWRFGLGWQELVTPEASQKMHERILQGPPRF